jgi:molybdopterin-guanine dinucleotide biosynthesis protein A
MINYQETAACTTGVILAGGRATRMGGRDKGLLPLAGKPMVEWVMAALKPQVADIIINANRNLDAYAAYGYRVVSDRLHGFCGPLAGIASSMESASTPYIVTTPCDSPLVPLDLAYRLYQALHINRAEISVAHNGERLQPVFALLTCTLSSSLLSYLEAGERKIDTWYSRHKLAIVDFSDSADAFININTPVEIQAIESRLLPVHPC